MALSILSLVVHHTKGTQKHYIFTSDTTDYNEMTQETSNAYSFLTPSPSASWHKYLSAMSINNAANDQVISLQCNVCYNEQ